MSDWPKVAPRPELAVLEQDRGVPVRRVLCIGRNYADHVREMGSDPSKPPVYFLKSADALLVGNPTAELPYPPLTNNLHHEVELVLCLRSGGRDLSRDQARACVFGYAVGLDMTRRDLQAKAKEARGPWAAAKDFDGAAIVGPLHTGPFDPDRGAIRLRVNGETRQEGDLAQMMWDVDGILCQLSKSVSLEPGDVIFTGTPAGVGAVRPGDRIDAQIEGLPPLIVQVR